MAVLRQTDINQFLRREQKSPRRKRIPDVVIRRLVLYLRALEEAERRENKAYISSEEIGQATGVKPTQFRKDMAIFGHFGTQRVGYEIYPLKKKLSRILNVNKTIKIGIAGSDEFSLAFLRYNFMRAAEDTEYPFKVVALFDDEGDEARYGELPEDIVVFPIDRIPEVAPELGIHMMVIAVNGGEAQRVADLCVAAQVKAILNFAPPKLNVPRGVRIHNTDLGLDLHHLAYYL